MSEVKLDVRDSPTHKFARLQPPSVGPARKIRNPFKAGWLYKRATSCGFWTRWNRRWVVIKGGYLFRFTSRTAHRVKGTPVCLLDTTASVVTEPAHGLARRTLHLVSIMKHQVYCADSDDDIAEWVHAIARARDLAIKQRLGHAPTDEDDLMASKIGDRMVKLKSRLDARGSGYPEAMAGSPTAVAFGAGIY